MKKVTRALAAMMLAAAVVFATGCKKDNDINGNTGDNNGLGGGGTNYEYVDLGLPSGTLWATCNVGATTPEGYGDYFAWGETQPKYYYGESTYKYCNGDMFQLTKYCFDSDYGYNGFTDNLTVLQPGDDAATENWGRGWRMPTKEQWWELYESTSNAWTTRNGVYGKLFTAPNGRSLFLPAAGVCWDGELNYVGSYGLYWTSSLCTGKGPEKAYGAYISDESGHVDNYFRYYGSSVRAVRSAK